MWKETTMDTAHDNPHEQQNRPVPDESLPPFAAYQVEEESRERAALSSGSAGERYHRGKVEAETHRISEEVTREAQQRLRMAQEAVLTALQSAVSSAATTPAVAPGATLPAPQAMKRFLIPLDGTLQGERVIPYSAELARLTHATLLLAHVTPTEPPAVVG